MVLGLYLNVCGLYCENPWYYRVCEDYNGAVSKVLGDKWINLQILSVQSLEAHHRVLLDGPGNRITTSRDVMFEELIPTHTVPLQGEIINLLGNSEDSMQPQLRNSAPRPEHPSRIPTLNPAVTNASPDQMIPNQIPVHNRPTDERPHPTCVPKPSRAQVESSEYLKCEENAREAGKDWANDLEFPLVPDDEDPEDIIALKASEICNLPEPENKWTPSHYAEAMMKPDLWVPAMDAEIHRMEEQDVWEVIPREPWMKLIDT